MTRDPSVGHGMGGCVAPITPRRIRMPCHPRVTEWTVIIQTHLPHLSKPPATVLALWSLGMVRAARPRSLTLVGVTALGSGLALRLRPPPAAGGWGGLAVLHQRLPSVPCCCPCAASLAVAASCTLAR